MTDLFSTETPIIEKPRMELKSKAYVSIDPGKTGAICAMVNERFIGKWVIPLLGKEVDIKALYNIISGLIGKYNVVLILEEVHSIFGTSASSNFTFGFVCGVIEAIVVSQDVKLIKVQPKAWQKTIWCNADLTYKPKKPEQKNASIDTKATSLRAAVRLFPTEDFTKSARSTNAHDGIIDAALISEYARRMNL